MGWHFCRNALAVAVIAFSLNFAGSGVSQGANVPESDKVIKIAVAESASQVFQSQIIGRILTEAGYNTELITAGYYPQIQGLADGDLHVATSLWSSNMGEGWMKLFESGQVHDAGGTGYVGVETWYANDKALEMCPGIDADWTLLKGCAKVFASAETFPKGRLLDYPIEWGTLNEPRIVALDLPFVSQPAGSEGAMIAEIKSAEERGEPLLIMFWSPHGIHANYRLTPIALPEYWDGCTDDPSGGINPNATFDCDWDQARVWKATWPGMSEVWPAALRIVESIEHADKDLVRMMNAIDVDGIELDAYIDQWMIDNRSRWQGWIDEASAE